MMMIMMEVQMHAVLEAVWTEIEMDAAFLPIWQSRGHALGPESERKRQIYERIQLNE